LTRRIWQMIWLIFMRMWLSAWRIQAEYPDGLRRMLEDAQRSVDP
jgi:hypothetical protein